MSPKAVKITASAGAFILAGILLAAYLFFLRPSDSDYDKVTASVTTLDASYKTIGDGLKSISYPSMVDETTPRSLQALITKHDEAIKNTEISVNESEDTAVKNAYQELKQNANAYNSELNDLLESIKAYVAALTACESMQETLATSNAKSSFDELAKNCKESIQQARSLDNSSVFKTEFLDQYTDKATNLLAAFKRIYESSNPTVIKSAQADASRIINEINSVSSTELDYDLPDISSKNILEVIQTQKGKLLR